VSRWRIYLGGTDVTAYVVTDDLPEWVETSVKGPGFFDWQVKPFTFRLHQSCPIAPEYGLPVAVAINGVERFTGVVDGVKDAFSKVPEITTQPPAVTLKDVMAGALGVGSNGQAQHVFEIRPQDELGIAEAIQAVLERYNQNKDPRLPTVSSWTVDVQGGTDDPVDFYSPHGLTGPQAGENHYQASGFVYEGNPNIPQQDISVPIAEYVQTRMDTNGDLLLGVFDVIWQVQLDPLLAIPLEAYRFARLRPGGPPSTNVISLGDRVSLAYWRSLPLAPRESSRLSESALTDYVRQTSGMGDAPSLSVEGVADMATGTWAVVDGPGSTLYATWWGDPLVQTISGKWANATMIDLIKQIALVSGRWLRVEGTTITLVPRDLGLDYLTLPDLDLAMESDQQQEYASPGGEIRVEVIDRSDPESWGMDYGLGKVAALTWWYVSRFTGLLVETEAVWPLSLAPDGLQLLSGTDYGQVNELDFSLDGQRFRVKTMQEGQ